MLKTVFESCSVRGEPLGGDWTIKTSDIGRRLVHGWISLEGGSELEEVGHWGVSLKNIPVPGVPPHLGPGCTPVLFSLCKVLPCHRPDTSVYILNLLNS